MRPSSKGPLKEIPHSLQKEKSIHGDLAVEYFIPSWKHQFRSSWFCFSHSPPFLVCQTASKVQNLRHNVFVQVKPMSFTLVKSICNLSKLTYSVHIWTTNVYFRMQMHCASMRQSGCTKMEAMRVWSSEGLGNCKISQCYHEQMLSANSHQKRSFISFNDGCKSTIWKWQINKLPH